jgi:hypothetical protein
LKVVLNVARELLTDEWVPCEGVKLREASDGSLDLYLARDLAAVREADARRRAAEDELARVLPQKDEGGS